MKNKTRLIFAAILLIAAVCVRADDGPPVTSDSGHPDGTTLPGGSVTGDPGGAGNDYGIDPSNPDYPNHESNHSEDGDSYLPADWWDFFPVD